MTVTEELSRIQDKMRDELSFREDDHAYLLRGIIRLPSVTQIMKPLYDRYYGSFGNTSAMNRGSIVHEQIEFFEKYGFVQESETGTAISGYFDAYKKWRETEGKDIKFAGSEVRLYEPKMLYAGTIDLLTDDSTIIDIKTTETPAIRLWAVQLAGYQGLLRSQSLLYRDRALVLQLKNDGTYAIHEPDTTDALNVFHALRYIHNYNLED